MKDADVAPPGVIPIQEPMTTLRSSVSQYWGSFFQVSHTTFALILALLPSNLRPSSMLTRISPMTEQSDDHNQEVDAPEQFGPAEGQAQLAADGIHADRGQTKTEHQGDDGLERILTRADEAGRR